MTPQDNPKLDHSVEMHLSKRAREDLYYVPLMSKVLLIRDLNNGVASLSQVQDFWIGVEQMTPKMSAVVLDHWADRSAEAIPYDAVLEAFNATPQVVNDPKVPQPIAEWWSWGQKLSFWGGSTLWKFLHEPHTYEWLVLQTLLWDPRWETRTAAVDSATWETVNAPGSIFGPDVAMVRPIVRRRQRCEEARYLTAAFIIEHAQDCPADQVEAMEMELGHVSSADLMTFSDMGRWAEFITDHDCWSARAYPGPLGPDSVVSDPEPEDNPPYARLTQAEMLADAELRHDTRIAKHRREAKNTMRYHLDDGREILQYMYTDVVTIWPNGDIELNTGGYITTTTNLRINDEIHRIELERKVYLPGIYNNKGTLMISNAYLNEPSWAMPFFDGMVITPEGFVDLDSVMDHIADVHPAALSDEDAVRRDALLEGVQTNPGGLQRRVAHTRSAFFETGTPVSFRHMRNTEGAPWCGSKFGQDLEPAGTYMLLDDFDLWRQPTPTWAYGQTVFRSPLVIATVADDDPEAPVYGPTGWKRRLSEAYQGLTGAQLSSAVLANGFDGVVTVGPAINDVREIVDLRCMPRSAALRARKNG